MAEGRCPSYKISGANTKKKISKYLVKINEH